MSNLKSVALTVLELLAFNSHDRPLRTHKQTHIERTHYLRHSLRSLGGDNKEMAERSSMHNMQIMKLQSVRRTVRSGRCLLCMRSSSNFCTICGAGEAGVKRDLDYSSFFLKLLVVSFST